MGIGEFLQVAVQAGIRGFDLSGQKADATEPKIAAAFASLFESGIKRESLYIQAKIDIYEAARLHPDMPIVEMVFERVKQSLANFGLEYFDSLVLERPARGKGGQGDTMASWLGMVEALNVGLTRQIGWARLYSMQELIRLYEESELTPGSVTPNVIQQTLIRESMDAKAFEEFCLSTGMYLQRVDSLKRTPRTSAVFGDALWNLFEKQKLHMKVALLP